MGNIIPKSVQCIHSATKRKGIHKACYEGLLQGILQDYAGLLLTITALIRALSLHRVDLGEVVVGGAGCLIHRVRD